eukprot:5890169-Alexandrium_andersonii.AAC.1
MDETSDTQGNMDSSAIHVKVGFQAVTSQARRYRACAAHNVFKTEHSPPRRPRQRKSRASGDGTALGRGSWDRPAPCWSA